MAKKTKSKTYEELSDYEKFQGACEGLKDVLNEKLCDNFLMITNRYVDSEIQKAKNDVMSPELQELKKYLIDYRLRCANPGFGIGPDMFLDVYIVKKIKELYGKQN